MDLFLPCTCEDEEHEISVETEGRGYNGPGVGDVMPCGRVLTKDDETKIHELIQARHEDYIENQTYED